MIHVFFYNNVFIDVARCVVNVLSDRGFTDVDLVNTIEDDDSMFIMFGMNIYSGKIPQRYVVYQLEQYTSKWFNSRYVALLKNATSVWDYSKCNIARLLELGINAVHVPIRYNEVLLHDAIELDTVGRIPRYVYRSKKRNTRRSKRIVDHNDYKDCIAIGTMCDIRKNVYKKIVAGGMSLVVHKNIWGSDRVDAIRKSKIAVNVRYFASGILEVVRLSYLIANRIPVITHRSIDNDLDNEYESYGVIFTDDIPKTCAIYANKLQSELDEISASAFEKFSSTKFLLPYDLSYLT